MSVGLETVAVTALQHGPEGMLVAVIILLLRSNAAKDRLITDITREALAMARLSQNLINKADG